MYKIYSILLVSLLLLVGCDESANSLSVTPEKTIGEVESENGFGQGELIDSLNAYGCIVYATTTVDEFNQTYPGVLPEESNGLITITPEDIQLFNGCNEPVYTNSSSSIIVSSSIITNSSSSSSVTPITSSSSFDVAVHPRLIRQYEVFPDSNDIELYQCNYERFGRARAIVQGDRGLSGDDEVRLNHNYCTFTSDRTETIIEKGEHAEWSELQFIDNSVELSTMQERELDSITVVFYLGRNASVNSKIMITINDNSVYDSLNLVTRLHTNDDYVGDVNLTFAISDLKLHKDHPNYGVSTQDGYVPIQVNSNKFERLNIRFIDTDPNYGKVNFYLRRMFLH